MCAHVTSTRGELKRKSHVHDRDTNRLVGCRSSCHRLTIVAHPPSADRRRWMRRFVDDDDSRSRRRKFVSLSDGDRTELGLLGLGRIVFRRVTLSNSWIEHDYLKTLFGKNTTGSIFRGSKLVNFRICEIGFVFVLPRASVHGRSSTKRELTESEREREREMFFQCKEPMFRPNYGHVNPFSLIKPRIKTERDGGNWKFAGPFKRNHVSLSRRGLHFVFHSAGIKRHPALSTSTFRAPVSADPLAN